MSTFPGIDDRHGLSEPLATSMHNCLIELVNIFGPERAPSYSGKSEIISRAQSAVCMNKLVGKYKGTPASHKVEDKLRTAPNEAQPRETRARDTPVKDQAGETEMPYTPASPLAGKNPSARNRPTSPPSPLARKAQSKNADGNTAEAKKQSKDTSDGTSETAGKQGARKEESKSYEGLGLHKSFAEGWTEAANMGITGSRVIEAMQEHKARMANGRKKK